MQQRFDVENISCAGCARAIERRLRTDPRIRAVTVDVPRGVVLIEAASDVRTDAAAALADLGYPERRPPA
ncbi:MAG TPA: heavy metal-associated domain-containing protein [Burkholderiaceae bacterium]|nr:heavy metal-associated domain-containing protein [Burkholderiaceae bacterium]